MKSIPVGSLVEILPSQNIDIPLEDFQEGLRLFVVGTDIDDAGETKLSLSCNLANIETLEAIYSLRKNLVARKLPLYGNLEEHRVLALLQTSLGCQVLTGFTVDQLKVIKRNAIH